MNSTNSPNSMNSMNSTNSINYAIQVKNLTKKFGSFTAVNNISFSVPEGIIFGFLGPNGAGKSTTIRMLCGILGATSGMGTVGGYSIITETEKIKQNIGYMSQKFSLYDDLTVEQNISFYAGIYQISGVKLKERKEWILEMAGLREHKKTLTSELAGGWKQRLALGCSLIHQPPIIFLDEPTAGVDPVSRRNFWDLIHTLSEEGTSIFVTTHYMDEAEHCNQLALIYHGLIIANGTPSSLKEQYRSGLLVEIDSSPLMPTLEFLETLDYVLEAAVFGNFIHSTLKADTELELLKEDCNKEGFELNRVEIITPSLEDVFVSFIQEVDKKS